MIWDCDLDKKVTLADADGPNKFIPELGKEVPTFIDPREDLIPPGAKNKFRRLSHHVPFKMRGNFRLTDWPEDVQLSKVGNVRTDKEGYILCSAYKTGRDSDGGRCNSRAVNRSHLCRNHGGALHPADKKMSPHNVAPVPQDRSAGLDRTQKFMQGFMSVEDLTDEEIQGMYVLNDQGVKVASLKLGTKFHQMLAQELHRRLNRFMQTKTASMINVMVDIAESDLVEPADRIKAAQWVSERVMGKTPDLLVHATVEKPYETIFDAIDAGSREDYRQKVASSRLELEGGENGNHYRENDEGSNGSDLGQILDVEVEDEDSLGEDWHSRPDPSDVQREGRDGDDDDQSGIHHDQQRDNLHHVSMVEEQRKERDRQKELKKARSKAKQRRFAGRAQGATTVKDLAWAIEWKEITRGQDRGKWKMKLVCPEEQTEAKLAKMNGT
ncbi:MAG TPA: hypothetical protein PK852_02675 [Mesotoga prima]|uniref:hypothetical protein n=1 Tax=Mesotoga prima TaxID=1184387 RepID=UPI002B669AF6|nr:hypothetical protein [Mesotoga prima]HPE53000.1 hypothetical protein [Mesotoga prima]